MEDKSNKNNKKRRIPKPVNKSKMKPTNPADINFEWDFGADSSEVTTIKNDCSKPSTSKQSEVTIIENDYSKPSISKQSEEITLISGECKSRVTCHLKYKESTVKSTLSKKQLCFKSISSPNIMRKTKNFSLARKLSASAPILSTTSADEEEIFTNSVNSSIPYLSLWSRDELFLHLSGDSQGQDIRKRVRFDRDSSDSENSINPSCNSNLIATSSYENICNHPHIDDIYNPQHLHTTESWSNRPIEVAASADNSVTSIRSIRFTVSTDVKPHLSITTINNSFCDNQPGTSSTFYNDQVRDHMSTKAILKNRFVVEKVSSTNLNPPPMEPSDNVDSSKCCDKEDRRSLNKVPHIPYPRLKLLKRAMATFFRGLLRAAKGKCLFKPKKTH